MESIERIRFATSQGAKPADDFRLNVWPADLHKAQQSMVRLVDPTCQINCDNEISFSPTD